MVVLKPGVFRLMQAALQTAIEKGFLILEVIIDPRPCYAGISSDFFDRDSQGALAVKIVGGDYEDMVHLCKSFPHSGAPFK